MAIGDDELILGAEARLSTDPFKRSAGTLVGIVGGVQQKFAGFSDQSVNTMANIGSALSQVGGQVVALGGNVRNTGSAFLGVFGEAITEAGSFEAGLEALRIATNASEADLATLKQTAIETGVETAFSPQEATQAMFELGSAGLEVNEILMVQRDVLDLVAASGQQIDLATGATIATVAMNKLGLELDEVNGFMDQLVRTNQVSQFHFDELEQFLRRLPARVGAARNSSVASFLAIGAAQRNAGVTAAEAGNSVRIFLRDLGEIEKQFRRGRGLKFEALQSLGLQISDLQDEQGRFLDITQLVGIVSEASARKGVEGEKLRNVLFNEQSRRLLDNVGNLEDVVTAEGERLSGLESLRREFALQAEGTDLAESAAQGFLDTWEGILKLVQGSVDTFKIVMGDTLLPLLKVIVSAGLDVFNVFLGWVQASRVLRVAIAVVTIGMGVFLFLTGSAIIAVGTLIVGLGGLVTAVATTVLAVNALNLSVATLETLLFPLILIVLALAAAFVQVGITIAMILIPPILVAIGIFALWRTNLGGFRDFWENVFDTMGSAYNAFHSIITGTPLSEEDMLQLQETPNLLQFISNLGMLLFRLRAFASGVMEGFQPAIDIASDAFSQMDLGLRQIRNSLAPFLGLEVHEAVLGSPDAWETLGFIVGSVIAIVVSMFTGLIGFVGLVLQGISFFINKLHELADFAGTLPQLAFNAGLGFFQMLTAGLSQGFEGTKSFMTGALQWIRDMLPGSEPRNSSSPLAGLGLAGAALLGNVLMGAQGAVPDFQSALSSSLVSARASLSPVVGVGPATAPGPPGAPAAAPGGGPGLSVSVSVDQIVFSGPVGTTEEDAANLARMVSEKLADELRVALTDGVAG